MVGAVNTGLAMRKIREEQELETVKTSTVRPPLDLHREWLELLRGEAREALQRYLAAGTEWRARL